MISTADYLLFVNDALDGMVEIVTDLGDDLANRRPDLPASNSPYALLTHCLGVIEHWAGHVALGRQVVRDRDGEFRASGPVGPLVERTARVRAQLEADVAAVQPFAAPLGATDPEDHDLPLARSQGGALIHIYEELQQHRGQMEGCRDVLLAPWARLV